MLLALNKPYGVLCQFTDRGGGEGGEPRRTLADFVKIPGVYPAGRLDYDSEGLLLLTDDGALTQRLTAPPVRAGSAAATGTGRRHDGTEKVYVAQVEGAPTDAQLLQLQQGILLNDGRTLPGRARRLDAAPGWLWPRDPPVRFRKTVPDAWIELTIREGRNRQVRRMLEAVGHPVRRLHRSVYAGLTLEGLEPGQWRELEPSEVRCLSRRAAQPCR